MYYLVFPDGSKLFQIPYPEDFVYHCLCLAIDKGLGLQPVKVLDYRGLYFFCFAPCAQEASPLLVFAFSRSFSIYDLTARKLLGAWYRLIKDVRLCILLRGRRSAFNRGSE